MNFLKKFFLNIWFPHTRILWVLLFLGFIFYESCGLYFQYWLKLNPCIECVYERACFMFFGVAALIGVIIPRIMIMRLAASAVWLLSLYAISSLLRLSRLFPQSSLACNCVFKPILFHQNADDMIRSIRDNRLHLRTVCRDVSQTHSDQF